MKLSICHYFMMIAVSVSCTTIFSGCIRFTAEPEYTEVNECQDLCETAFQYSLPISKRFSTKQECRSACAEKLKDPHCSYLYRRAGNCIVQRYLKGALFGSYESQVRKCELACYFEIEMVFLCKPETNSEDSPAVEYQKTDSKSVTTKTPDAIGPLRGILDATKPAW